MKLTIENWSIKEIKEEIKDFSHVEKVELAVFCDEKVLGFFECKHQDDKRPRIAIEAAKEFIKNPTEENKQKCKTAADAAYDAYTAYAADYADDADACTDYAAYTASYAVDTAADAAVKIESLKQEIINYIKELKGEKTTKEQNEKSIYTHELMVRGGTNTSEQYEPALKVFSGQKFSVFINENGKEYVRKNSKVKFRLIDARTDEEKLIDEMVGVISRHCQDGGALRDLPKTLLEHYDITPK